MNKSGRLSLLFSLAVIIIIAGIVLAYVVLRLEIERMNKERLTLEESLNSELNRKVSLNVEAQKLESYQRIVGLAEQKLGMVKNTDEITVLEISKDKVEGILNAVNSKYE